MRLPSQKLLRVFRVLDRVQNTLLWVQKLIMMLIVVAIVGVSAAVWITKPFGAGNQGEYFYFGMFALLGLMAAGAKWMAIANRLERDQQLEQAFSPLSLFDGSSAEKESTTEEVYPLENGHGVVIKKSIQFDVTGLLPDSLANLVRDLLPDMESLDHVEDLIEDGYTFEAACEEALPAYSRLSGLRQKAYTALVKQILEQRRQLTSTT